MLNLQSWLYSDVEIIRGMTFKMIEKFDKYWSEMNGLLAIASTLDPRNKMDSVDFYFNEIYKDGASGEIKRVSSLLYDLLAEYIDRKSNVPEVENVTFETPASDPSLSQK